jgi:hypothetical protein
MSKVNRESGSPDENRKASGAGERRLSMEKWLDRARAETPIHTKVSAAEVLRALRESR